MDEIYLLEGRVAARRGGSSSFSKSRGLSITIDLRRRRGREALPEFPPKSFFTNNV
jgi:hypothetical protein